MPLFGNISRFTDQKGIDILIDALEERLGDEAAFQFVGLGMGDRFLERAMSNLAKRHPNQIAVKIGYDKGLAHLIEAAVIFM